MITIGLTGGIASGKTTVSDLLRERGAVIIDSDVLAREVVEPGTPGLAAVVARFGEGVLDPDRRLDRPALGAIVFADPEGRAELEQILHPAIRRRAAELQEAAPADAVVVHVIPLLVETGQQDRFDRVVVVDVSPETQLERLLARDDALTPDQARARINAQADRTARLAVGDAVISNDGSAEDTVAQVDRLWAEMGVL
ncbi:MAG: dephospho-CoA kinase [Propionibacteriaceae bacterium]